MPAQSKRNTPLLQIASGKLFTQSPARRNELRGVLHTNLLLLGKEPIETIAGRLLPTDLIHQHNNQLVYEITELIEQPPEVGTLVSHGITPYLSDFAAIASLALNVTCTVDPETAARLIGGKRGINVNHSPREFIPRVFDSQVSCQDKDTAHLIEIVGNLIGLQRKSFLAAMRAIRTYVVGLHRIADDLELAYVLLIASIESLAQDFDHFQAGWNDYDETKRSKIDDALINADQDTARKVRTALLETERYSLAKRFREFAMAYLDSSYFREEADGTMLPASRADLQGALKEAYGLRSRYVHSLQELPRQLTMAPFPGETIRIDGRIYLTFRGIARLARHIIIEFVRRQTKVKTESYDYSEERAGTVQLEMAPQYWIGNADNVTAASGRRRLEGFLTQLIACISEEKDAAITDLREVLRKVETMLPTMSVGHRVPFLALYFLYDNVVPNDHKMPGANDVRDKYWSEIEEVSIEGLLTHSLLGLPVYWPVADHRRIHEDYFLQRATKAGLKMPRSMEAGISVALAERYRAAGDVEEAQALVKRAVENYPGHAALQSLEAGFRAAEKIDWWKVVFASTIGQSSGIRQT